MPAPWIGTMKVNRSQPMESNPLTMNTERRGAWRNKSTTRTLPPDVVDELFAGAERSNVASTTSDITENVARQRNVARWPATSIMKPAITGPSMVDVENPSARRENACVRFCGVLAWPTALLTAMWVIMNPEPSRTPAKYRPYSDGRTAGSTAPVISMAREMIAGLKTPTRSVQRPACTDNTIGTAASKLIRMPTRNGVAPSSIANSISATRPPVNVMCASTIMAIKASRFKGEV
jgi:hypothetical protein